MKNLKIVAVLILLFSLQFLSAQKNETYYFSKTVDGKIEDVTIKVKSELKKQGFGVLSEMDMDIKLKEKLKDIKLKPYKILGVCDPSIAYQTIQEEENIGLFLPCKVLVKDLGNGKIEVVMINPSDLMKRIGNKKLDVIAKKITDKFLAALEKL